MDEIVALEFENVLGRLLRITYSLNKTDSIQSYSGF